MQTNSNAYCDFGTISTTYPYTSASRSVLFLLFLNWGGGGIDKCLGGVNLREEQIYIEKH